MRLLFCILAWTLLLPAPQPDNNVGEVLRAALALHIEAEDTAIRLLERLEAEYDKGATDVSRSFWNTEVLTRCDSVNTCLTEAIRHLDAVMPKTIRDAFWREAHIYRSELESIRVRLDDSDSIYGSEYQRMLIGASSNLIVYLTVFHARTSEMDGALGRFYPIFLDGPELHNRKAKEQDRQKREQERRQREENRRAAQARAKADKLRDATPSRHVGTGKVSVLGIPLGTEYDLFVQQLQSAGFSLKTERCEDVALYGRRKEAFLTGTWDGNPAVIRLTASATTRSIYEAELILREFIDEDEATEEADRLWTREKSRYPNISVDPTPVLQATRDPSPTQMPAKMVDLPEGDGKRIVRHMAFAKTELWMRLYDELPREDAGNSFGSITFMICQLSLDHEHIVYLRYYDRAVGDAAWAEARQEGGR